MRKPVVLSIALLLLVVLMACVFIPSQDWNPSDVLENVVTKVPDIVSPNVPPVFVNAEDLANVDQVLTTLYERVNPGVVTIIATTRQGEGSGSGFVYDYEGHILTNYHVVKDAETIEVDFASGKKIYGDVIATDVDSDIAVIHVDMPAAELVPLSLGDSDQLKVGQMVVAIGNPYRLTSTMTLGVVSAKGRILDSLRTTEDFTSYTAGDLIQTDAAINHGNSGGALVNSSGEIIGVNVAIASSGSSTTSGDEGGSIGVGFAIPIDYAKRVAQELIDNGSATHGLLGATVTAQASDTSGGQNASSFSVGAQVVSVSDDSAAAKAGLQKGDVITGVNGRSVKDSQTVTAAIREIPANGEAEIRFTRNGKEQTAKVNVGTLSNN